MFSNDFCVQHKNESEKQGSATAVSLDTAAQELLAIYSYSWSKNILASWSHIHLSTIHNHNLKLAVMKKRNVTLQYKGHKS